jgi:hypothetical protein
MNNFPRESVLQPMPLMKQATANMDDLEFAEILHRELPRPFADKTRLSISPSTSETELAFETAPTRLLARCLSKL